MAVLELRVNAKRLAQLSLNVLFLFFVILNDSDSTTDMVLWGPGGAGQRCLIFQCQDG